MPDQRLEDLLRIDAAKPSPGRMYDYFLGGKDNYAADREAAEQILKIAPETATLARDNRAFLRRAAEFLLDEGIGQFLDIGTGLPTQGHLAQVVGARAPDARIVCVDNDPMVCAHARALTGGKVPVIEADMRDPEAVLVAAREVIDFTRPVGLVFAGVLHFVTDDQQARRIVAAFRDALAAGSFLVLSHGTQHGLSEQVAREGLEIYRRSSAPTRLRMPEEVAEFFDGCTIIEPGLINVALWRPLHPVTPRSGAYMLGAVARVNPPAQ